MKEGRPFKKSMLEYCKTILSKMSFNRRLFLKEYRKSLSYLTAEERHQLKEWVRREQEAEVDSYR